MYMRVTPHHPTAFLLRLVLPQDSLPGLKSVSDKEFNLVVLAILAKITVRFAIQQEKIGAYGKGICNGIARLSGYHP